MACSFWPPERSFIGWWGYAEAARRSFSKRPKTFGKCRRQHGSGALDWFRSAIALRPTGEIEGDTPEAVMSRLEGAIARRDFVTAESLLAALPAPMLTAGEDVPALVASQAEATRFLDVLRTSALSGEVGQ